MIIDLKKIFNTGADKLVSSIGKVIDSTFTNDEERMKAQADLDRVKLGVQQEIDRHMEAVIDDSTKQMELILSDKQNAREMYKTNSSLQKIYALTFLGVYMILACIILWEIFNPGAVDIPAWGVQFIATLFGGMTMKLSTITDFLFGSGMEQKKP